MPSIPGVTSVEDDGNQQPTAVLRYPPTSTGSGISQSTLDAALAPLATADAVATAVDGRVPRLPGARRTVRGVRYVAKTSSVDVTAPFLRADYFLDTSLNPNPRLQDIVGAGHSWLETSPTPDSLWFHGLADMLGVPDARRLKPGIAGGTTINPTGGPGISSSAAFPSDGQSARALRVNIVPNAPAASADPAFGKSWAPSHAAVFSCIGFNDPTICDYFGATDWELVFREGYRCYLAAWRMCRLHTIDDPALVFSSNWLRQPSTTLNPGAGRMVCATNPETVTHVVAADYDGRPIDLPFNMDNAAKFSWKTTVTLDNVAVPGASFDTAPLAAARGYQSASNPGATPPVAGGGVTLPGVHRITGLTAAAAGKTLRITITPDAGAYGCFTGLFYEADTPIMEVSIPLIPDAIGSSVNARKVTRVAQLQKAVIDEFPTDKIAFLEWAPDNLMSASAAGWNKVGDTHPSLLGQFLVKNEVYDNIRSSPVFMSEATTRTAPPPATPPRYATAPQNRRRPGVHIGDIEGYQRQLPQLAANRAYVSRFVLTRALDPLSLSFYVGVAGNAADLLFPAILDASDPTSWKRLWSDPTGMAANITGVRKRVLGVPLRLEPDRELVSYLALPTSLAGAAPYVVAGGTQDGGFLASIFGSGPPDVGIINTGGPCPATINPATVNVSNTAIRMVLRDDA